MNIGKSMKDEILEEIGYYKENIESFESRGARGTYDDFERLARCELLLEDIKKARAYFEESDKSWLWYLDHNKEYIKEKWRSDTYLTYYKDRGLVIFFAYGKETARKFINTHIGEIGEHWKERLKIIEGYGHKLDRGYASGEIASMIDVLLHLYLIIDDKDSLLKIFDDISQRFEKYGRRVYEDDEVGERTILSITMPKAEIIKAIIESYKEGFLMAMKEYAKIKENILVENETEMLIGYADLEMVFYSEMARQIWHDLVMDLPFIPEKLKSSSYFEELKTLGGAEE